MIDSNAPYANNIKLYDSSDKGYTMSAKFAICDIECREILGHSEVEIKQERLNDV